jgi:hypothetical protein
VKFNLIALFIWISFLSAQWETISWPNNEQIDKIIADENILYAGTVLAKVYQSVDQGESWTQVGGDIDEISYATDVLHKKENVLFFSHNIGSDDYNFRSFYNGEDWEAWEPLPYQTSSFTQMKSNADYLFTIISGGIAYSDDYGDTWTLMSQPPLEGYINIPFVDNNYLYVSHGCTLYRTDSMGEYWEDVTGVLDDIGPPEPYGCTSIQAMEMVADKLSTSMYWYGGVGRLFYSENYGDTWEWINTFPSQSGSGMGDNNVNALAGLSDYLFAGTATSQDGLFYTNDYENWTEYSGGLESYSLSFANIISTNEFLFKTGGTVSVFRAPIPEEINSEITIVVDHLSGWNMIGLPLNVDDTYCLSIFPNAVEGTLFGFDNYYIQSEFLETGNGYWLRFQSDGTSTISGQSLDELSIELTSGWNMISGISQTVSVSSIDDPDQLIINGTVYGFNNGYEPAETIEPGQGYWIRSSGNGEITLVSPDN